MKVFDKPILVQYKNREMRQWITFQQLHAHINTTSSNEYTSAGSTRSSYSLTFTVRYNPELKKVALALQDYRIAWDGGFYRITSYDDFGLTHQTVKLVAENHGGAEQLTEERFTGESYAGERYTESFTEQRFAGNRLRGERL